METKLQNLVSQVGTDVSGKWLAVDRIDQLAELIVQECRTALRPELRDMISRGQAYDQIKKHFGIE
jgi:hypothetical protein